MKKLFVYAMVVVLAMPCAGVAQEKTQKEMKKERKEVAKMSRDELSGKVSKTTQKEAKRLKKEGWVVSPGALPLEKQLERSYLMQYEYDENNMPKYIMSEAMSIGETYDAAKFQALELAKQNLAGQIATDVTMLVENEVSNNQLAREEAASIVESVSASKNRIAQRLGRLLPVVEAYRSKQNKNQEVLVRFALDVQYAKDIAKSVIREDLQKKGNKLHEQLDKVFGF
ncbi:MAG: hypothetical protein ACI392_01765 [Paludibacteraceae bacterium]